ncbi:hypothetical protein [Micromonospora sp. CB01531]|uniref:hypothetical protein n=1 Tax=Micromonospora sp. CB01531 TaxID=1718947 RepID=UPI0011612EBF|nr:hypothetical protein [Micromonospora sp. CB01531]
MVDSRGRGRRNTDTAWALAVTAVVLGGWSAAVALLFMSVVPLIAAGAFLSHASAAEQRRLQLAFLTSVALVIAAPALAGWLAWRRRWLLATYWLGGLAGVLAVLLCGWLGLHVLASP